MHSILAAGRLTRTVYTKITRPPPHTPPPHHPPHGTPGRSSRPRQSAATRRSAQRVRADAAAHPALPQTPSGASTSVPEPNRVRVRAAGRPGTTAVLEEGPHPTGELSSHSSSLPSGAPGGSAGPCRGCRSAAGTPSGLMLTNLVAGVGPVDDFWGCLTAISLPAIWVAATTVTLLLNHQKSSPVPDLTRRWRCSPRAEPA